MSKELCGVILSAGLGKRLRPITLTTPKPLLPVLDVPLLSIAAEKLSRQGAASIHCNAFHLKKQIKRYIESTDLEITLHEEAELLGTGGGIGNMKHDLKGCREVLLHNGDIVSNIDYEEAIEVHRSRNALMTMILLRSGPPLNVCCSRGGEVTGIGPENDLTDCEERLGYSGMAILSPEALEFFPCGTKANLVDIMNRMIEKRRGGIVYYTPPKEREALWIDIGTPRNYLNVHKSIITEKKRFDPLLKPPPLGIFTDRGAEVDPGARWSGFVSLQRDSRVERDTFIENCIVMEGAVVKRGSSYKDSIITRDAVIDAGRSGL